MKDKTENEKRLAELRYAETRWEASSEIIRRELAVSELKRLKVKRQIVELKRQINNEGTNDEN